MDIRKIFGKNVKKYRLKKGYTQEQLAELADIGDKIISPIETGRSFIALDKMERLCNVLEVEPFQLFLTGDSGADITDDARRQRVFARLQACSTEELELLCDVLNRFIER